jgi:hypothetical protein
MGAIKIVNNSRLFFVSAVEQPHFAFDNQGLGVMNNWL